LTQRIPVSSMKSSREYLDATTCALPGLSRRPIGLT